MSDWWVSGKTGRLAPVEQAKFWALTTMADEFEVKLTAKQIAGVLTKVGGGRPQERAVQRWQDVFRQDPEWYPGKTIEDGEKPGPKPQLTSQKKQAIASSAMAVKRAGKEPTVAAVRARCPAATWNPGTGGPKLHINTDVFLRGGVGQDLYEEPAGQ